MNQNIRFSRNEEEVSILKLDAHTKQPFKVEHVSTINTVDQLGKPITREVYECTFDLYSVDVCDGDFIVIGSRPVYHNGKMVMAQYVEAHTLDSIKKNFSAYDEYEQNYLDNIADAFVDIDIEPSDDEILEVDQELEKIIYQATHLTIDDLYDDEEI